MKLGFIGCGNMSSAIIGGIINKGIEKRENIIASTATEASAKKAEESLGIECTTDNKKVVKNSKILFLGVKPQFLESVIRNIKGDVSEEQVIVSIAAGKSLAWLEECFGKKLKIIRTMPNTPALVGEGMTGVCPNEQVTEEELNCVLEMLTSFGKAEVMTEKILDVVGAAAGSSPAYVFMFIEAMADAAVAEGMPRKQAYACVARAVLGSAKMVLETGKHPGELKDMVCSPAGTTIEGLGVLEKSGFRSAAMEAVRACVKKTREL